VTLEVFDAEEDDSDRYMWWVIAASNGHALRSGEAVGFSNAVAACEAAL
jgi:hypothetical protein